MFQCSEKLGTYILNNKAVVKSIRLHLCNGYYVPIRNNDMENTHSFTQYHCLPVTGPSTRDEQQQTWHCSLGAYTLLTEADKTKGQSRLLTNALR